MWQNNGLSIVAFGAFLVAIVGQVVTGLHQYNQEQIEEGGKVLTVWPYLLSGHFLEATFENWESEFLQMAMFVVLTAFLYQRGSAESNDPDDPDEDKPKEPVKPEDVPWPVRRGGWVLKLYKNSLGLSLFLLFVLSFILHWFGSLKSYNHDQLLKGAPLETAIGFLGNSKLWFESFQNWQSEFLSVGVMVVFTIFLRQKGSAQSKPVEAPDSQTGE
ncbi:MAG: hypothetical protein EOO16_00420 [Chitinophagaceae bacterium]|nr:MAG: hypothetical protein EOO16_00420 [Chitinophagaceae bacterium]